MIYLDNSATTPICNKALETLVKYSSENYYNPSAIYLQGVNVNRDIESAKQTITNALGVKYNNNLIFTSGATEANNLAILGAYRKSFKKMLFSVGEHPSVYNVALELKKRGVDVDFVKLQQNGEIDYIDLENKLNKEVSFISIMLVNNETGAINDIHRVFELKNKYCPDAILHSDGVQAFGKIKINLDFLGVDLFTVSAHKIFGPKGIGALFVKNKNLLNPIIFGGGQEYSIRSGTENVGAIMAFKSAVDDFGNIKDNYNHVSKCVDAFLGELKTINCLINSHHSPYVLSLSFCGINGETLVHMMEKRDILISRGSACSSKKSGNRILENMGLTNEQTLGSIRISFSKNTTIEDAIFAGKTLYECYNELKDRLKWTR